MMIEKFSYTSKVKKSIIFIALLGICMLFLGILMASQSTHDLSMDSHSHSHNVFHWTKRLWANLWINNVFFTGVSIIGVFFVALQYVTRSGWSAGLKRVPEAFGYWLPIGGLIMLATFLIASHELFHWTHSYLYDIESELYDPIIVGKKPYLNYFFYLFRMGLYFTVWTSFFFIIRKQSLQEDIKGGLTYYRKKVKYSAFFIIFFAITSSTSAWDWILSIDTHWFSTMLGWYVFASWHVSGLCFITLFIIFLKDNGYLKNINENHLHDLGKCVFGFSVFWTYIWFSQFMLIYYANIPEETIYFVERLQTENYFALFFVNLIVNFAFPFIGLMARDAKRYPIFLKLVCCVLICGHWLDFYLMVTPGVLAEHGELGMMEIGSMLLYLSAFLHVVLTQLSKSPLVAINHPLINESIHHHV